MSSWSDRFSGDRLTKHENGMVTHGLAEPVLTVLKARGFELCDLFLIGVNSDCGSILVPTQRRAEEIKAALEPAYAVEVGQLAIGDWSAEFSRCPVDGTVLG